MWFHMKLWTFFFVVLTSETVGVNYNNHFGDKSIWKDVIPYEVIEVPISDLSVVPAIHSS